MYCALAHVSKCLLCFVLGKCSVNRPPTSKLVKDDKQGKMVVLVMMYYADIFRDVLGEFQWMEL